MFVNELTKQFGRGEETVLAVDHLTFSLQKGEVYGLLGANGAGKTTTLRMILGLLEPTWGDVELDGFRVTEHPDEIKRRIGLVSASAGLYQWLTPREHLTFFADAYGVSEEEATKRSQQLIELLQLGDFVDRRCAVLSTGQRQRVNLARSLIHDPPVMLFDEPTRGLDIVGTQVVFDFIRHLKSEGKSVIVCTHRLDEAERLCDRFGLLDRGRLRFEGPLELLQEQTGRTSLVEIFTLIMQQSAEEAGIGEREGELS
ncbi:ABC transporter ATP-binding protein [Calycomorphotria hydatis]|uniref:Daunorubicin/doxorubicin resistance ATP-binding protein DrrA n=1 Tax=Calycomorphotria hydatis TaxID=2528027 RepID=A0A517T8D3_9PLAN|nr:ATP-binding cassette domain-containing protein [Calycomorphotria hydatis]QDT64633.1 Daunorubicin/doxorubicin resistance ATP-binding protein DrrA [Calycomorphotria hydatis]